MRISLTTPDGRRFEVDPETITMLEDAKPGIYDPKVVTVVYAAGHVQGVCETIDRIEELEHPKTTSFLLFLSKLRWHRENIHAI